MDITNKIVKICRRITDIEHSLACKDQDERKTEELNEELNKLSFDLDNLYKLRVGK
jgi:hypothetical protein